MADRKTPTVPRFLPSGDTVLAVEFGSDVDRHLNDEVLALYDRVTAARIPGVIEAVPTFRSLMVQYDPLAIQTTDLRGKLEKMLGGLVGAKHAGRRWSIPICYGGEHGPDLDDVARRTGMKPKQVIDAHAAVDFHVYMIGFLPGFPYMGDLPENLALPRRENPRVKVPRGSVGIAMRLSAIYTLASPGGWNLIGRTPAPLWDQRADPPAILAPGDTVRFAPISPAEFDRLDRCAADGAFRLKEAA